MVSEVNSDLDRIHDLITKCGMKINSSKCDAIIFAQPHTAARMESVPSVRINGTVVPYSENVRYLGVTLNRSLTPKPHSNRIISNVNVSLLKIRHLKNVLPNYVKLNLISSVVMPIFDYGDIFCESYRTHGFCGISEELQKSQNRCLRYALSLRSNERMTHQRNNVCWLTSENRRLLHVGEAIHSIVNGSAPSYLNGMFRFNTNATRQFGSLVVNKAARNMDRLSITVGGADFYNSISNNIKNVTSINEFSNLLRENLMRSQTRDIR